MSTNTPKTDNQEPRLLFFAKMIALAFAIGMALHFGERTAEEIWPTPALQLEFKD